MATARLPAHTHTLRAHLCAHNNFHRDSHRRRRDTTILQHRRGTTRFFRTTDSLLKTVRTFPPSRCADASSRASNVPSRHRHRRRRAKRIRSGWFSPRLFSTAPRDPSSMYRRGKILSVRINRTKAGTKTHSWTRCKLCL